MSVLTATQRNYANELVSFIHSSPTPFHAVSTAKSILVKAGFIELAEREPWAEKIQRGKKYFVSRNGSSLIAFGVGGKWEPGKGFGIIGAHTDSPVLRLKPVSKRTDEGYLTVGVETYGGGIWHSWYDRDLSLAGRILLSSSGSKHVAHRLINVEKPILRIPTLAIHLDRTANEGFKFNRETEFRPIVGLVEETLNTPASTPSSSTVSDSAPIATRHHSQLLNVLAETLAEPAEEIKDFELVLYDTQPPTLGGLNDEFIFAPRLDNLCMSFCAVKAIEESEGLEGDETIRVISLFDHEEIGSLTSHGADSNFLPTILSRLSSLSASNKSNASATVFEESLSKSFLISADMAHAVHPNYSTKYEDKHKPKLNQGVVLKINANARYATNTPGMVLLDEIARRAGKGVELQRFVVRNDSSCGSTIGPMLAAKLGLRTVDLGNPQLSMHSCRETGGSKDVESAVKLFKCFFEEFGSVEPYVYGGELKL